MAYPDLSPFEIVSLVLCVYAIGPTILVRIARFGAISRAPGGKSRVALTFDDGPDPRYTPQILDILKRHQVKACFFVIGQKAREYPELIKQIVQAGHEIGNHGFNHRMPWLLGPGATLREIKEASRAIEETAGRSIRFYRPAWGLCNFFSLCYYWLKGQQVILWTYMSWDWIKKATPEGITRKVLSKIKDGAILVLHDSDTTPGAAPGAPARVVSALPEILEGLKRLGLQVVPLTEITRHRPHRSVISVIQRCWKLIDAVIRRLSGITDPGGKGSPGVYRLALRRYHGRDLRLPDGVVLQKRDHYAELHLNNDYLLELTKQSNSTAGMGLSLARSGQDAMPVIARHLTEEPRFQKAKAILAVTLMHRGAERLGFSIHDLQPGVFPWLTRWYEIWLLILFHPDGLKRFKKHKHKLTLKQIAMSRAELMRRYLS
ncbi:MAG: polysaccharide deacetylase family protein [Peptococcaceae bacterium]|nr:MAG: polysaccharide deacetylase family protein [Peptococcaceae bacterium]